MKKIEFIVTQIIGAIIFFIFVIATLIYIFI